MPYPVPAADKALYDTVAYQGYYMDMKPDDVPRTHECVLYGQMLFSAFHTILQRAPSRILFPVFQFCLSGGCARFMHLKAYHKSVHKINNTEERTERERK